MVTTTVHPVFDPESALNLYRVAIPESEAALRRLFLLGFPALETSASLAQRSKNYARVRAFHLKDVSDVRYVVLNPIIYHEVDGKLTAKITPESVFTHCTAMLMRDHNLEQLAACTMIGTSDPIMEALTLPRIKEGRTSTRILASLPQIQVEVQPGGNLDLVIPFGDVVGGWPNKAIIILLFS